MGTGLSYATPPASLNAQGTVAISTAPTVAASPVALGVNDTRVLPTPTAAANNFKMPYDTNLGYTETVASAMAYAVPQINAGATAISFALITANNMDTSMATRLVPTGSAGTTVLLGGTTPAFGQVTSAQVDSTIIRADGNNAFTGNQSFGTHNITSVGSLSADTLQNTTTNGPLTLTTTGTSPAVLIAAGKTLRLGATAGSPANFALQDVWYDSTNKTIMAYTDVDTTSRMVYSAYNNGTTTSTIASSNALTAFSPAYTVPAGALNVGGSAGTGRVLEVYADGYYNTTATPTLLLALQVGGANALASNAITTAGAGNRAWSAKFVVQVKATGSTNTLCITGHFTWSTGAGAHIADLTTTVTFYSANLANALQFNIAAQWGTANAANTITIGNMYMKVIA